jgi:hypothetical protein
MRTSKRLKGGAFGLLLIFLITLPLALKERKSQTTPPAENFPPKEKREVIVQQTEKALIKVVLFNPKRALPSRLSGSPTEVTVKWEGEGEELSCIGKRGELEGSRLKLKAVSGRVCGFNLEAEELRLNLKEPTKLTLYRFNIRKSKRGIKGIYRSTFELRELCSLLREGPKGSGNIVSPRKAPEAKDGEQAP